MTSHSGKRGFVDTALADQLGVGVGNADAFAMAADAVQNGCVVAATKPPPSFRQADVFAFGEHAIHGLLTWSDVFAFSARP